MNSPRQKWMNQLKGGDGKKNKKNIIRNCKRVPRDKRRQNNFEISGGECFSEDIKPHFARMNF